MIQTTPASVGWAVHPLGFALGLRLLASSHLAWTVSLNKSQAFTLTVPSEDGMLEADHSDLLIGCLCQVIWVLGSGQVVRREEESLG